MRLAIMQPYLFPYLGYFQLINNVEKFIVLDNVNYINKGWINRNRILVNGREYVFTIPLKKVSQNKLINEIEIAGEEKWRTKLLKTIINNYKHSPFFNSVFPIVEQSLNEKEKKISEFIVKSLKRIMHYLSISTEIVNSSAVYSTGNLKGVDRILKICKQENADTYLNLIGGQNIYDKKKFTQTGVNLLFIQTYFKEYKQSCNEFIPGLSIIDLLMNNGRDDLKAMLKNFQLI